MWKRRIVFFADAVNVKMNTLMNKPATVSMLAKKCGYNSLKTFTRHFKKYLGITPYQWMMGKKNGLCALKTINHPPFL